MQNTNKATWTAEIKRLLKIQEVFIDVQDWTEVSRCQFEIDNLKQQRDSIKEITFDTWFCVAWSAIVLPVIINQLIYTLQIIIRVKGEQWCPS
jgi:hypothetical protein